MGCNMCVVKRPEEQYKILFQKGYTNTLRPLDGNRNVKVRGRHLSQLPLDRPQNSQDALQATGSAHRGHRRKGGAEAVSVSGASLSSVALVTIPDCIDNGTQTEISFQNLLTLGRGAHGGRRHHNPPASSAPPADHMGPYDRQPHVLDDNHGDCVSISQHGQPQHQYLEYEEVSMYKSSQQEKLGLTVCYRTDVEEQEEENLGLYVGEVNPHSIAARTGRIQEGDRILQINGVDVHNRDEAVAILSREDSVNLFLLLVRPEQEAGEEEEERGGSEEILVETSPELDSGVGQTEESSDLLEQSSTCYTTTTSTPGSLGMLSPRPSSSPGPGREDPTLLHLQDLQFSSDSLLGLDWVSGPGYSPRYQQVPGLTDDECERYQELLEIKCQYERTGVAAQSSRHLAREEARGARDGGLPEEEEEEEEREVLSQREVALMEEELRHLEFKCRNILRAQKMQQLRERCLKTWTTEEETVLTNNNDDEDTEEDDDDEEDSRQELSAINEAPERERADEQDSTSAYNTGDSSQDTPLVSTEQIPPLARDEAEEHKRGRGAFSPPSPLLLLQLKRLPPLPSPLTPRHQGQERRASNCSFSPGSYRKYQIEANRSSAHGSSSTPPAPSKFRSLSREAGSDSRRGVVYDGPSSRAGGAPSSPGGGSAESSPYFSRRLYSLTSSPLERYQSCLALPSEGLVEVLDRPPHPSLGGRREDREGNSPASPRSASGAPCGLEDHRRHRGRASRLGLALPLGPPHEPPPPTSSPRMEWKVKVRSDGSRYVSRRPGRDRLRRERALRIREERGGATTDDDGSEVKQGRYWSREERKQQLLRAREYRRRREFMMQSRLDYGRRECCSTLPGAADHPPEPRPQQEGPGDNILLLSQRRKARKRSRRILEHWVTIQDLLARGTRTPDGTRVYSPRLSVTTV